MASQVKTALFAAVAAAAAAAAAVAAEPIDWMAKAREMVAEGASSDIGRTDETGNYVLVAVLVPADASMSPAEALASAKISAKRLAAGMVGGENVSASEDYSVSESSSGAADAATEERFSQKISIDVNQLVRGMTVVGEVSGADGDRRLVMVATQRMAEASAAVCGGVDGNPGAVRAAGFSCVSGGDVAAARKAALADAKTTAVEMVLGTSVAATDSSLDGRASAKVFANAGGFVKRFSVESEGMVGDTAYKVVAVVEVAKDELLASYASVLESMGDIRFWVDCGNPFLRELLAEAFSGWGCHVTEDAGAAQYVVECHGKFDDLVHPGDGRPGTRLTMGVRILDRATGREMLAAQNDSRTATSFVGDRMRRKHAVCQKSIDGMRGTIHAKLDEMIGRMAASGRDVRLELDNYSGFYAETLDAIAACVAKIPGCEAPATQANASRGTATVTFKCKTDIDNVRTFLARKMAADIPDPVRRPREVGHDANSISLTW